MKIREKTYDLEFERLWSKLFKPRQPTPLENVITCRFGDQLRKLGVSKLYFDSGFRRDVRNGDRYASVWTDWGYFDIEWSALTKQGNIPMDPGLWIDVKPQRIIVAEHKLTRSMFPQAVLARIDAVVCEIERLAQKQSELSSRLSAIADAWSEIERAHRSCHVSKPYSAEAATIMPGRKPDTAKSGASNREGIRIAKRRGEIRMRIVRALIMALLGLPVVLLLYKGIEWGLPRFFITHEMPLP